MGANLNILLLQTLPLPQTVSPAPLQVGPRGGPVPANFSQQMTSKYGQESILVIPRWATRIYFDVSLPAEAQMEHNSFYGPRCLGNNLGM